MAATWCEGDRGRGPGAAPCALSWFLPSREGLYCGVKAKGGHPGGLADLVAAWS